jgi:dTDP-4-dehydrorhamnose reductase
MPDILIIGHKGQLGTELLDTHPADLKVVGIDIDELDITDRDATIRHIADENPATVINAAAYTAVDAAEDNQDAAHLANAVAPGHVAEGCAAVGAKMVHISTDFVFAGDSTRPYKPGDETNPLSVYGRTKLEGEVAAQSHGDHCTIVRTAWLYSPYGNNFVKTMLRLMEDRDELSVVSDQVGTPTHARGLAELVWALVPKPSGRILHWSDLGVASWYDFAVAIQEEARVLGKLSSNCSVRPIPSDDYPQ